MPLDEIFEYMKAVVEGRDDLMPFARWLHDNNSALQERFNRGTYLRIKNRPVPEFRRILNENDVAL